MSKLSSPFHPGEQILQTQVGVRDRMEKFGSRVIRDHMPPQHRDFYQQQPFLRLALLFLCAKMLAERKLPTGRAKYKSSTGKFSRKGF